MSCVYFVFLVLKTGHHASNCFRPAIPMSSTPRLGGSIWSQHSEVWHPKLRKCWNLPVGPWLFGCLGHLFFWGEWLSLVVGISKSHLRWWECLSTKRCQRWSMNSLKRIFFIFLWLTLNQNVTIRMQINTWCPKKGGQELDQNEPAGT